LITLLLFSEKGAGLSDFAYPSSGSDKKDDFTRDHKLANIIGGFQILVITHSPLISFTRFLQIILPSIGMSMEACHDLTALELTIRMRRHSNQVSLTDWPTDDTQRAVVVRDYEASLFMPTGNSRSRIQPSGFQGSANRRVPKDLVVRL